MTDQTTSSPLPSALDPKERLKLPPQTLPKQDPRQRIHNWDEVSLSLSEEVARLEAARCLRCKGAHCAQACPLHNDIASAMALIEAGDFIGAANKFRETSPMPEMCGRLCPQELQCEGNCGVGKKNAPVAIGRLEAFVADYQRQREGFPMPPMSSPTGQRVAVVGSGPAGLVVAEELAKRGHSVVIYEAWPLPGGILRYGIPSFKMSKAMVDEKITFLEKLGVRFVCNTTVGESVTLDDLFASGFAAVFLGHGAGQPVKMGIPGEDLKGIYQATEFLVCCNLPPEHLPPSMREPIDVGKRVVVVGGGDTAMDCLRTAIRMGAPDVCCLYRRSEAEMPGSRKEKRNSNEEGVQFTYLAAPVSFTGDTKGRVKSAICQRMELGEPDDSGRRRPVPIAGSEFEMEVDTVVLALGYRADKLLQTTTPGLEADKWGLLTVDPETGGTSRPGVFAGGDNVRGPDLVVDAVVDAKRAAAAIDEYLRRKSLGET
jgi:glutamate synthase (NADPH/NADH) small chain